MVESIKKMAANTAFVVFLWCTWAIVQGQRVQDPSPVDAVKGVVSRVLGPKYVDMFQYDVIPADISTNHDVFEVTELAGKPLLKGNTGVSLASAFNFYLKYYCSASISWGRNGTGDQLSLPYPLPLPKTPVRVVSPVKYRYYMNVCTVSYSMVWWDWDRWQRELDWMAMNGINLPLSFTGQEYVWWQLYRKVGLTNEQIFEYFSGPAFLAWQRMGNIKKWAGPLSESWCLAQRDLQINILARSRQLGMLSVLPGFAGHVPDALVTLYPGHKFIKTTPVGNFNDTYTRDYLLEPTDPLFVKLGNMFYEELNATFGTDHFYNADTYNEMTPSSNDSSFLAATNKAIYQAMVDVDPDAVFVMQGWLFHNNTHFWNNQTIKAFLSGVSDKSMLILDLFAEEDPVWIRTESFFGKPFIWCMLHNFGGLPGIYGNLTTIATAPIDARRAKGSTMVGTGMTPEAIEQNPVVYELMAEMGWRAEKVNVSQWLVAYSRRRYNSTSKILQQAWSTLYQSAYVHNFQWKFKSKIETPPWIDMFESQDINTTGLVAAWKLLYKAGLINEVDRSLGTYQYDLVDVGRQCLANIFCDLQKMVKVAYVVWLKDKQNLTSYVQLQHLADVMLEVLLRLDNLLQSNTNFLLGHWIADARASVAGESEDVQDRYEFNARNQVTIWGYADNLGDYAAKHWAGLVDSYYFRRWNLFFKYVTTNVSNGSPVNQSAFEAARIALDTTWNYAVGPFPTKPCGDPFTITQELVSKYADVPTSSNYKSFTDVDIPGHDLFAGLDVPWTHDLHQIRFLCDSNTACVGYNSQGGLKNSTSGGFQPAKGTVFFLKLSM